MPHRRTAKTGSFGSHFDQLVEQFKAERPHATIKRKSAAPKIKAVTPARLNRLLLDRKS